MVLSDEKIISLERVLAARVLTYHQCGYYFSVFALSGSIVCCSIFELDKREIVVNERWRPVRVRVLVRRDL